VIPALDKLALAPLSLQPSTEKPRLLGATPARCSTVVKHKNPRSRGSNHSNWSPMVLVWAIGTSDFCLVLVAAAGAFATYYDVVDSYLARPNLHLLTAFLAAALFVGGFERLGGYRLKHLSQLKWQLTRILMTWGITGSLLLLVAFISKISQTFSRAWMLVWIFATVALQLVGRCLLEIARQRWAQGGFLARNIVIFGAGEEGQQLVAKLQEPRDKSIAILGMFDDRRSRIPKTFGNVTLLGTSDDLLRFASEVRIDEVIVALPLDAEQRLKTLFEKFKAIAVDLRLSVEPIANRFQSRGMSYIGVAPVLEIIDRPFKHWRAVTKWIEDKSLAALLLLTLAPLIGFVALLIKLDSRGPVFFVQRRFGFNNEIIRVLKFRTMYVDRGDLSGGQRTVPDDPRVTRVGRVIRALSIDELPQLINVLRGEMSIVGPRPHAIAMKAGNGMLYGDVVTQYCHRHRVKPGITGWAQVNGLRGEVDTLFKAHARVDHDLYYIEHWSPWFDLKILIKTLLVIMREPAY
jgi:Undecaprenyl-phosphate glucose phosphotransferase